MKYRFCTDERAAGLSTDIGSIGWCNRFDEGATYRDIVQNVSESYDRTYLFSNFRRYRSGFDIGNYVTNSLIGRRFIILQNVYQNLLYKYTSDPSFRNNHGALGFDDEFMASADILNFYNKVLGEPDVGCFRWNAGWQRYEFASTDAGSPGCQLSVPIGLGKYSNTVYQSGLSGINRIERIGTFYDKLITLQLMTTRGYGSDYTRDVPFYTNFYDLFPLETEQIFTGLIKGTPEEYAPHIVCDSGTFPDCTGPHVVYPDEYRGDCSDPAHPENCRPNPQQVFSSEPVLDGNTYSFLLQVYAAVYGLSEFPVFFDTSFDNEMFVCVEGEGDCHAPSASAVEGTDYVRYTSRRYGKNFLAWQTQPPGTAGATQTSVGFSLVKEAHDEDFIERMLETYRGDFGGAMPYSLSNLTPSQQSDLAALGYTIPGASATVNSEISRYDSRVRNLESFFNEVVQLENQMGIAGYLSF